MSVAFDQNRTVKKRLNAKKQGISTISIYESIQKAIKNTERGNSTADFSDTFGLFFFNLFPIGNDIK